MSTSDVMDRSFRYKFDDFTQLFRLIRNTLAHFHEVGTKLKVKETIGSTESSYIQYMTKCFPWLLIFSEMIVEKLGSLIIGLN
jgi:hypothetical protein